MRYATRRRLAAARRALARQVEVGAAEPTIDEVRWCRAQLRFLRHRGQYVLLRAGNQVVGKTTAGLARIIDLCDGRDRWGIAWRQPPIEAWVVAAQHDQSVAIQAKAWALVRQRDVHPDTQFDPVRGFRGRQPVLRFRNGSLIRFLSSSAEPVRFAGATIDAVLFDEPPTQRVWVEATRRVKARGGRIYLTLTPVNRPCDWLRDLVEAGVVADIHVRADPAELLDEAGLPIVGPDGRARDAAWLEELAFGVPEWERPVVVHGEWETTADGAIFSAFSGLHVTAEVPAVDLEMCLGIDHGSYEGREVAVLVGVERRDGGHLRIWVLDEYVGREDSTWADDAAGILDMLKRWHLSWAQLDYAWGDRIYKRGAITKSNKDLMREIAKKLLGGQKKWHALSPRIRTVKRDGTGRSGSVAYGVRWLHQAMVRQDEHGYPDFRVNPRCTRLIDALEKWDGNTRSPEKDPIDALRYALWAHQWGLERRVTPRVVVGR